MTKIRVLQIFSGGAAGYTAYAIYNAGPNWFTLAGAFLLGITVALIVCSETILRMQNIIVGQRLTINTVLSALWAAREMPFRPMPGDAADREKPPSLH